MSAAHLLACPVLWPFSKWKASNGNFLCVFSSLTKAHTKRLNPVSIEFKGSGITLEYGNEEELDAVWYHIN